MFNYILNDQPTKFQLQKILENMNRDYDTITKNNISQLLPDTARTAGYLIGEPKAIEFALSNNLDRNLIKDRWFTFADKIENFD